MEMDFGDDVLRKAALDGSMDYSAWPQLLPTVLERIQEDYRAQYHRACAPSAAAPLSPSPAALPKPVADMLNEVLSVLRTNFTQYPPHTIQRLSELVLRPRQHYRNLVPYLHALDRVVHVTSGANTYPLPPALPDVGAMSLLANGIGGGGAASLHHLDGRVRTESTETIEGPNGMGSIETVSVSVNGIPSTGAAGGGVALLTQRSVTQGELLRQEQRAGLVPLSQIRQQPQPQPQPQPGAGDEDDPMTEPSTTTSEQEKEEEEDEIPHARGPAEIGPADTGPQPASPASYITSSIGGGIQGLNVEAAVGRRLASPPAAAATGQEEKDLRSSPEVGSASGGGGGGGGNIIPRSPKREAPDELEPAGVGRKRVKEDVAEVEGSSQQQAGGGDGGAKGGQEGGVSLLLLLGLQSQRLMPRGILSLSMLMTMWLLLLMRRMMGWQR
ncbi:hypothetical protein N0V88_006495 [Collariella sp. IMI 366227]|nr:hypothetical protein N0V88_006495 [Collariella sp. IMI 366227]